VAFSILPVVTIAETSESVRIQQNQAREESKAITADLNHAIQQANEKYTEVETLQEKLDQSKKEVKKFDSKIKETEKNIGKRKQVVAAQMQDLQVTDRNLTFLELIFSSGSLTEFIQKTVALSILRQAQTEKIQILNESRATLKNLKEKKEKTVEDVKKQKEDLTEESESLTERVSALKSQSLNNQKLLAELQSKAYFLTDEEQKNRDEAMQTSMDEVSNEKTTSNENSSTPSKTPNHPSKPSGSTGSGTHLTVQSTGYSYAQPGLGYHTATGIDLRKNPMCIAVDPRVIPLGSMVEVPGYGIAIAGDTGGAIIGNIIDLHFTTVQKCINWGRRTITIKILS
jgi:3D (Asp-Asp-Asp) domain-containing protein